MGKLDKEIKEAFHQLIEHRDFPVPILQQEEWKKEEIQEIYQKAKKRKSVLFWKKAVRTAVMVMGTAMAAGITAYAIRQGILLYQKNRNVDIYIADDFKAIEIETILEIYELSYLPPGYDWLERMESEFLCVTEYVGSEGEMIVFMQQLSTAQYNADTEETESAIIMVHDDVGYYFRKNDHSTLIWTQDSYLFELSGFPAVSSEEMVKMAESIQKKEGEGYEEENEF